MSSFSGQRALVFGGETGIGRAAAEVLAARGCSVLIAGILEDPGAETVASIRQAGGDISFVTTDVRIPRQVETATEDAREKTGRIDIMIYACGVYDGYAACLDVGEDLWDQVLEINLKGCFRACQSVLGTMVPQGYGRIVAVASVASYIGTADGLPYTVSKSGMLGMVRHVGTSYASHGITMNAVCPGVITTDMRANSARVLGTVAPPMERGVGYDPDAYKNFVPAQRRGAPSEVGELMAFIASREAGYITGQGFVIDGGWLAA